MAPPWSLIASASASIGSNSSGPMAATTPARSNASLPRSRRCAWRSSNVPTTVQDASSCRVAGSSNGPFRGSAETDVWARTTKTSLTPSWPSSHSPASNSPSGGSRGRRPLSQALNSTALPLFLTENDLPEPARAKYSEVYALFLARREIEELPLMLFSRKKPIRRNKLSFYLTYIQHLALSSIFSLYIKGVAL